MASLTGRIALVTGSTSGIGLGIAAALAAEGADIMLHGLGDAQAIETARAGLERASGVQVAVSGADLRSGAGVRRMVADAHAAFGRIDILVNNAGIQVTADLVDFPDEAWDDVIAVNLSAAFHATKAATPGMVARGWGRVVNIASAHGLVGSARKSAYVAAKHGLLGLTKVAAIEFANTGITVNALCPGWVLTPLVAAQIEARAAASGRGVAAETASLLSEKQPMAEFTTPEQIGALVAFLCSDQARTMTGAPLAIDGGWTAG